MLRRFAVIPLIVYRKRSVFPNWPMRAEWPATDRTGRRMARRPPGRFRGPAPAVGPRAAVGRGIGGFELIYACPGMWRSLGDRASTVCPARMFVRSRVWTSGTSRTCHVGSVRLVRFPRPGFRLAVVVGLAVTAVAFGVSKHAIVNNTSRPLAGEPGRSFTAN